MHQTSLPATAFVAPDQQNLAQASELVRKVVTLAIEHLAHAGSRPPMPVEPYQPAIPLLSVDPVPEKELLDELAALLGASMNPANPGYIGHMDSLPTTMSIAGELVAAAVNNNMLSLEMSPALSRLEQTLVSEFATLFGLGPGSGGTLVSGGTLANLQALAVARNHAFQSRAQGIVGLARPPVVLASEQAHASIPKAAMLLGLGTKAVVPVNTDANARMDCADLESKIQHATAADQQPFAVVATAGTTTTGNIDPLEEVASVAQEHGLWLHVDAAYGGALIFSEQHRHRLRGIERADSITFNPQKWLYVAKTCAMVLFRDKSLLESVFRVQAPYMRGTQDFVNLGEIGVQGTRHADALKLWLSLRHLGRNGYAELIEGGYTVAIPRLP